MRADGLANPFWHGLRGHFVEWDKNFSAFLLTLRTAF